MVSKEHAKLAAECYNWLYEANRTQDNTSETLHTDLLFSALAWRIRCICCMVTRTKRLWLVVPQRAWFRYIFYAQGAVGIWCALVVEWACRWWRYASSRQVTFWKHAEHATNWGLDYPAEKGLKLSYCGAPKATKRLATRRKTYPQVIIPILGHQKLECFDSRIAICSRSAKNHLTIKNPHLRLYTGVPQNHSNLTLIASWKRL